MLSAAKHLCLSLREIDPEMIRDSSRACPERSRRAQNDNCEMFIYINSLGDLLRTGTTRVARFHRSKPRSKSPLQRHDARRTRCAPREVVRPLSGCPLLTQPACPMARHTLHHYRLPAEYGKSGRSNAT